MIQPGVGGNDLNELNKTKFLYLTVPFAGDRTIRMIWMICKTGWSKLFWLWNWLVSYWICIRNGIRCYPAQFQFPYCDVVETFFVCDPTSPAGNLNRWYWESRGILRPSLFRHSDPCKWTPFTGSGLKTGWVVWGPTQEYRKVLVRGTIESECMVWW